MVNKNNALQFEGLKTFSDVLKFYDNTSDSWIFEKKDDFWEAVKLAHQNGKKGKGTRIAIIDGGFDLEREKLSRNCKLVFQTQESPAKILHGTAVALLVLEVAPEIEIELYDISLNNKPNINKLKEAINIIGDSSNDIINLSFGRPQKKSFFKKNNLGSREHCDVCSMMSPLIKNGKLVVAAAGNSKGDFFCPAMREDIVSIGFQGVDRIIGNTDTGGESEGARAARPSFSQSLGVNHSLLQPPGVLGSSFATPLISASISLLNDPKEIGSYLLLSYYRAIAEQLHFLLRESNYKNDTINETRDAYNLALSHLPHFHYFKENEPFCFGCSYFAHGLFVNSGLFFLEIMDFLKAEPLLIVSAKLAPWSFHAKANLGTLYREMAKEDYLENKITDKTHVKIRKSISFYEDALSLRKDFSPYITGLKETHYLNQLLRSKGN